MKSNKFFNVVLGMMVLLIVGMVWFESTTETMFAVSLVEDAPAEETPVETQPEVTQLDVRALATEPVAEPQMSAQDTFMAGVYDEYRYELYAQLFEMYDFETLMSRDIVPQFQTLYLDRFSDNTIKTSGCGITCLSMVATYLFEEKVTPDMFLVWDVYGGNSAAVMERAIIEMDMRCDMYYGMDAVNALDPALEAGNPCILLMRAPSIFTRGGHFIVVTGKTEDGRYIVNDPNLENYFREEYADAYANGFTREQILYGLFGTYVFDSKAEFEGDPALIPHN